MPKFYKLIGKTPFPCTIEEWALWLEKNQDKKVVAQEEVGPLQVSTVFLGLDHNLLGYGPPLLFETMIFGESMEGHFLDSYCDRCATYEDAVDMHRKGVEEAKKRLASADKLKVINVGTIAF